MKREAWMSDADWEAAVWDKMHAMSRAFEDTFITATYAEEGVNLTQHEARLIAEDLRASVGLPPIPRELS